MSINVLIVGSATALFLDRRRNLVFSIDELTHSLPCPLLKQLDVTDTSTWIEPIELLAAGTLAKPNTGPVALIPVGQLPATQLREFSQILQQALGKRELITTKDLLKCRERTHQILLASPGSANRLQLQHLRMRLALQGKPIAGWVLLDNN